MAAACNQPAGTTGTVYSGNPLFDGWYADPASIEKDGKYYFFFAVNDVHEGQTGGIGVAVADRPEGPYSDLLGKPLINDIVNGAQPIDQYVFRDNDGRIMPVRISFEGVPARPLAGR